jgi:hypothetical protein
VAPDRLKGFEGALAVAVNAPYERNAPDLLELQDGLLERALDMVRGL